MPTKLILAIVTFVILIGIVLVSTGKGQEWIIKPLEEKTELASYCSYWVSIGCPEKDPKIREILIGKNICKDTGCKEENEAGCNCGDKKTTPEKLFCCIQGTQGETYANSGDEGCSKCTPDPGSSSDAALKYRMRYECSKYMVDKALLCTNCQYCT